MLEEVFSSDECSIKSFHLLYREDEGKYIPSKRQYLFTNRHGVKSQKTWFFNSNTTRT